jgi:hypothetical protein
MLPDNLAQVAALSDEKTLAGLEQAVRIFARSLQSIPVVTGGKRYI